ncbi:hypothetical protein JB92DRAFT_3099348 [Gautieria morchelliformis]|nr:hypothetical protein JB92DRAFT_3099348 [Gautieria morchelliformis]
MHDLTTSDGLTEAPVTLLTQGYDSPKDTTSPLQGKVRELDGFKRAVWRERIMERVNDEERLVVACHTRYIPTCDLTHTVDSSLWRRTHFAVDELGFSPPSFVRPGHAWKVFSAIAVQDLATKIFSFWTKSAALVALAILSVEIGTLPSAMTCCLGCSQNFPGLESTQSQCAKCNKLTAAGSDTERKAIEAFAQCLGCSVVYPFLKEKLCGACCDDAKTNSTTVSEYLAYKSSIHEASTSEHRLNKVKRPLKVNLKKAGEILKKNEALKRYNKTDSETGNHANCSSNDKSGGVNKPKPKPFFLVARAVSDTSYLDLDTAEMLESTEALYTHLATNELLSSRDLKERMITMQLCLYQEASQSTDEDMEIIRSLSTSSHCNMCSMDLRKRKVSETTNVTAECKTIHIGVEDSEVETILIPQNWQQFINTGKKEGGYLGYGFVKFAFMYGAKNIPDIKWNADDAFLGCLVEPLAEVPAHEQSKQSLLYSTFLATPLLPFPVGPGGMEQKISGNGEVGENTDHIGIWVDAYMHHTLVDSEGEYLFVDIQGFKYSDKHLILFDPQAHIYDYSSGFWDKGPPAIVAFLKEHKCNKVCPQLGLHREIVPRKQVDGSTTSADAMHEKKGNNSKLDPLSKPDTVHSGNLIGAYISGNMD